MRELRDKVAVVTGAASGIGRALAERFAAEGMRVVLADLDRERLAACADEMRAGGANVLAVPTDVSQATEVEALARRALDAFGAVHVVCNNAGVGAFGTAWEQPVTDWEWVIGVNLWGVVHGVRTFVPILLAQGEGHVVNTASLGGLVTGTFVPSYYVSKHAVVALSEVLYKELAALGGGVGVSVLCPGLTRTRIVDASRSIGVAAGERRAAFARTMKEEAWPPERIAEQVVAAIREERFYVLTHPGSVDAIRARFDPILSGRNPTP